MCPGRSVCPNLQIFCEIQNFTLVESFIKLWVKSLHTIRSEKLKLTSDGFWTKWYSLLHVPDPCSSSSASIFKSFSCDSEMKSCRMWEGKRVGDHVVIEKCFCSHRLFQLATAQTQAVHKGSEHEHHGAQKIIQHLLLSTASNLLKDWHSSYLEFGDVSSNCLPIISGRHLSLEFLPYLWGQ